MIRITASAFERIANCPTSVALPQYPESTEASERGTDNHSGIEGQLRAHRNNGADLSPELAQVVAGLDIVLIEGAFVVNVYSGEYRFLGESIERDYGELAKHEVGCTVDIALRDPITDDIVILDWKSRGRVTKAFRNWQLKIQALAVTRWALDTFGGYRDVQVGVVYLDDWEQDRASVAVDIIMINDVLGRVEAARAAKPTDSVNMGPWCDYCPAQHACPGRMAIVRAAIPDFGELKTIEPEKAGEFWERLKVMADMVEKAQEVLKARARKEGLPLPNGKRLMLSTYKKQVTDWEETRRLLGGREPPKKTIEIDALRAMNPKNDAECTDIEAEGEVYSG